MIIVFFDKESHLSKKASLFYVPLLIFVYYITMLNTVWFGITSDPEFIRASLFYIYNCLVFLLILKMYSIYGNSLFHVILYGLVVALLLELATLLRSYNLVYRSIGSFNNPNQLGYFSVLSISIFSLLAKDLKINFLFEVIVVLAVLLIVVLSLSKAALIAILFNIIFVFFKNFKYAFSLFAVFVFIYFLTDASNSIIIKLDTRLSTFGVQNDDNLIGRAYDRIWENPEYLILGAGDGLTERFTHNGIKKEIHSSFGSVLFSYGIFGFTLFFYFFYLIFKYSKKESLIYLLPSLLYGTTHQGFRFTFFWILLALLVIKTSNSSSFKISLFK